MKKILLTLTAVVAGTAVAAYIIKKRRNSQNQNNDGASFKRPSHHVTNVFAKAKEQLES